MSITAENTGGNLLTAFPRKFVLAVLSFMTWIPVNVSPSLSLSSESESSGSVGLANLADQRMAIGEIVTQESTVNSLAGFNTEWVDD